MNREEILMRNKNDNSQMDEYEKEEIGNGFGIGGIFVAVVCIICSIFEAVNGNHFYQYGSIIFVYLCGMSINMAAKTSKKAYVVQSIMTGAVSIAGLVLYIMGV